LPQRSVDLTASAPVKAVTSRWEDSDGCLRISRKARQPFRAAHGFPCSQKAGFPTPDLSRFRGGRRRGSEIVRLPGGPRGPGAIQFERERPLSGTRPGKIVRVGLRRRLPPCGDALSEWWSTVRHVAMPAERATFGRCAPWTQDPQEFAVTKATERSQLSLTSLRRSAVSVAEPRGLNSRCTTRWSAALPYGSSFGRRSEPLRAFRTRRSSVAPVTRMIGFPITTVPVAPTPTTLSSRRVCSHDPRTERKGYWPNIGRWSARLQ